MDNKDHTSEDKKRNREENESPTNQSKKIPRTLNKDDKQEDKLDQLLTVMQELKKETQKLTNEVKEIKEEQREYRKEIKDLRKEIAEIKKENISLQNGKEQIVKELTETKRRLERLEKEKKTNNIIVQGLPIDSHNQKLLKEAMTNFMKEEMDIEVKIHEAIKLGNKTCLVKMENSQEKTRVMQSKIKLRNMREHRVFINDDLTKEELQIQEKIRQIAKEEINNGKNVKIKFNKLIVDGKTWKWNRSRDQLEELPKND